MPKKTMENLGIYLHDFMHYRWVNETAREHWETRFESIARCLLDPRLILTIIKTRPCSLFAVQPYKLLWLRPQVKKAGLSLEILDYQDCLQTPNYYVPVKTQRGRLFIAIGQKGSVADFKQAWVSRQCEAIHRLLGAPDCCMRLLKDLESNGQLADPVWPISRNTIDAVYSNVGSTTLDIDTSPYQSNIFLRWLDLHMVLHLPCSFSCHATIQMANHLEQAARELEFNKEMDWLSEILSWPVEWSTHGAVSRIKTPGAEISTNTFVSEHLYLIKRKGNISSGTTESVIGN
jgi:hypothetical protein